MSARKDYRLTVKVRNNNILKAAEAAGFTSIPLLASAIGMNYSALNNLINMTASPFSKNGVLRPCVERLCEFLSAPFDDLFSEQQRVALDTNRSEREVDAETVYALTAAVNTPEMIGHDDGLLDTVLGALGTLTPREEKVLRMRVGMDGADMTLAEVADAMGITPERVRQIEQKAYRKLRHPSRADQLRDFLPEACWGNAA